MPRFEKGRLFIDEMAEELMTEFKSYEPLRGNGVTVDFLLAYGDRDDNGIVTSPAITLGGVQCLGLCSITPYKQRVKGCRDAEIQLDADFFLSADRPEQRALLDHELHHIMVVEQAPGKAKRDHADRPKLKLRHHDYDFGWFKIIAERHGPASAERQQAKQLMEFAGQYFFPGFAGLFTAAENNLAQVTFAKAS